MAQRLPPTADCWFLSGPTASGKTRLGIELARRLVAEILSMDSMAVYRGMDIGTAKPTPQERAEAPHHFVDCLDPAEEFSLASYLRAAADLVAEIRGRGQQALFVGGTPLYLKGLLRGIFEGPPADWDFRRGLEAEIATDGAAPLHARLQSVDPAAAARLHVNDTRRIIRALEVYEKTGQPISVLQRQFESGRPASACKVFVLQWEKAELHRRIDARVESMFAEGLVEEVESLLGRDRPLSRTASQALGYREVLEMLDGQRNLAETIDLVKLRTRQFAKRQETWFRSLSECRPVPMAPQREVSDVADAILRQTGG